MNLISVVQKISKSIVSTFSGFQPELVPVTGCFPSKKIRWNQVKIKFCDGHTISVWVGGRKYGCFTYGELEMSDKRNANPNMQWELLGRFANSYGQIARYELPLSYDCFKFQKRLLSEKLRSFLKINGEPIKLLKNEKVYKCNFQIEPES